MANDAVKLGVAAAVDTFTASLHALMHHNLEAITVDKSPDDAYRAGRTDAAYR